MSSRRTLILVGAIAVGAIAALMILRYVGSVEDKAASDSQLVQVVVATGDIHRGELADAAISDKRIDFGKRRRLDLPVNAITRVEDVMGQTAAIDLSAGQVITASMFSGASDNSSSSSNEISPGNVAITVSVGASGLVSPGDYVNLLADITTSGGPDGSDGVAGSGYVFQKVKVLAVGTNLGTPTAAPADGTATTLPAASDQVTLDVPPEAAAVISANATKNLRLVMVRPDYQPRPIPAYIIDPLKPLPGADGRTPYDGQPATAAPTAGAGR